MRSRYTAETQACRFLLIMQDVEYSEMFANAAVNLTLTLWNPLWKTNSHYVNASRSHSFGQLVLMTIFGLKN